MRRGTGSRPPFPRLPDPPDDYNREWAADLLRALDQALELISASQITPPKVQVECTRSGDAAELTVTITDYDRRLTAIEFNKREGTGVESGFVSTWDSETGTIGTDFVLTRVESISVPDGLDSAGEVRWKWRDQYGAVQTEGQPIPLPNLAAVGKTATIMFSTFKAKTPSVAQISYNGDAITPAGLATNTPIVGSVDLPAGVSITSFSLRGARAAVTDTVEATLKKRPSGGGVANVSTTLSITAGAGEETQTENNLNETTVSTTAYYVEGMLRSTSAFADGSLYTAVVGYSAPDYSKTR